MEELEMQIMADLNIVVKNVTEWAENELREFIEYYVYEFGRQKRHEAEDKGQISWYHNGTGKPTRQFLKSITHESMHEDLSNYVGYMIFSDPTKMEYDSSTYLHGNSMHDYRAALLERLNEAKDDMPTDMRIRWRWWKNREPFFDLYLDYLDGHIYQRFEYEMTKVGFKWRKGA